jgi:GT2 family glycosyltransferase
MSGLRARLVAALREKSATYSDWVKKYDSPAVWSRRKVQTEISRWTNSPKISVLMSLNPGVDLALLIASVQSVRSQSYENWELCVSQDESTPNEARDLLTGLADQDGRIRVCLNSGCDGCASYNHALTFASGEFIALLGQHDVLPAHALYGLTKVILTHSTIDMVNSDEDSIDLKGRRLDPHFKTAWNPALMLSQNAFGNIAAYRRSLIQKAGGFRDELGYLQEHELALRCARATSLHKIKHVPLILYHRRLSNENDSLAVGHDAAVPALQRALEQDLAETLPAARMQVIAPNRYQVNFDPPFPQPCISIVIPTTGNPALLDRCVNSILKLTSYHNFEIMLLVNRSYLQDDDRRRCLERASTPNNVRLMLYDSRPFNYSWVVNWGVTHANSELICLLNDDTELITADWLEQLAARILIPNVAAVGAMLYYPNETIQHAGVILGLGGIAGHAFHGQPRGHAGYYDRARVEQDLSCVTAACCMIRREVFLQLGGFDEKLAIAFNDVDFCIRLRNAGWRIIWTPLVELYHHESASVGRHDASHRKRQFNEECILMRQRWGALLDADPFYNPNLSLAYQFSLAFPPRLANRIGAQNGRVTHAGLKLEGR